MEFCERGCLSDILADELVEVPWPTRWSIARDTAVGLNYMHEKHTLHRYYVVAVFAVTNTFIAK